MLTYEEITKSEAIKTYIIRADESLGALGFTEHSFAHVMHVAGTAGYILETISNTIRWYALDNRHAKEHLPQSTAAQMGGGTVLYVHQMRVFSVVTQGHYRGNCPADGPSTPNANRFQRCPREGKSQNNT